MMSLAEALIALTQELTLTGDQVKKIATDFQSVMAICLEKNDGSLKMLPSYLTTPNGNEAGNFLAVDFGGTNVRILEIKLSNGQIKVVNKLIFPVKDPTGKYDYTAREAQGKDLFDFISKKVADLILPNHKYALGFTFSFPCRQYAIDKAELILWTKEFKTAGVVGQDVGALFQAALERRDLPVTVNAIINDTVGTLLAGAYKDTTVDIASICGTGHNTCYLEPLSPLTGLPMIINIESGNFNILPFTVYDDKLDLLSEKPGAQRLEKMVSGCYLGELTRLIVEAFITKKLLFTDLDCHELLTVGTISTENMASAIADNTPDLVEIEKLFALHWGIIHSHKADRTTFKTICSLVAMRSARLAGATFLGILNRIDPGLTRYHTIAIDGSLYEKMPEFKENLFNVLAEGLPGSHKKITLVLAKDGSGNGAAIGAAIAAST